MQLFSQRDPRWASHPVGWGPPPPGKIGPVGCYLTCLAMIVRDAFADMAYTPASLDEVFTKRRVYTRDAQGDFDLMPSAPLDAIWPKRFKTSIHEGFNASLVSAGVASKDTYVILWISTKAVPTHFVIAASKDGRYIADPWTGKIGALAGYGGPAAVHRTIVIRKLALPPPVVLVVPKPAAAPAPAPVAAPPAKPDAVDWDAVEQHSLPNTPLPRPSQPTPEVVDASLQGILLALINLLPPSTRAAVAQILAGFAR